MGVSLRILPHGAVVLGLKGSDDAFNNALSEVKDNKFTGYLEVRMKIRGGELWGVVVFEAGNLVETYANRLGTDIFGETAFLYLMELAKDPESNIVLHSLDSDNLMDFIMSGRGRKIKIEDDSWRPGQKPIPGLEALIAEGDGQEAEPPMGTGAIKKVVLLGDPSVGKTSSMRRFVEDTFDEAYLSTIGSNVNKKSIMLMEDDSHPTEVTMMVWDVAGDKASDSLKRAYYRGAHGAIVVCDITLESSFEHIPEWIDNLFEIAGKIPVLIIGNKADLADLRVVSLVDLKDMADRYESLAVETSARTGENVEMVFHTLACQMMSDA